MLPPLCQRRGGRTGGPSPGGPPQTAGQTIREVGLRELGQAVFTLLPSPRFECYSTWSCVLVCLWRNLRKLSGWVSHTRMRSPVPSARWAEGERPSGLLGHELDIHVRDTHLNLPSTLTQSPGETKRRGRHLEIKDVTNDCTSVGLHVCKHFGIGDFQHSFFITFIVIFISVTVLDKQPNNLS